MKILRIGGIMCAGALTAQIIKGAVRWVKVKRAESMEHIPVDITSRQRRFIDFASIIFDNQYYMTPRDFLESMVEYRPRPRLMRRKLSDDDVKMVQKAAIAARSKFLQFHSLQTHGIISYGEYLFLISALTKSSGYLRLAFDMLDFNYDGSISKEEFLQIRNIVVESRAKMRVEEDYVSDSKIALCDVLTKNCDVDTTLSLYFFGINGDRQLQFETFRKFIANLETDILTLEFHAFARGRDTISEVDFAKSLLRYTYADSRDQDIFISNLKSKLSEEVGFTKEEFIDFYRFFKYINDLLLGLRIILLTHKTIDEETFKRGVRVFIHKKLNDRMVHTFFVIFDREKEKELNISKFMFILRDRQNRRYKLVKPDAWNEFKLCVTHKLIYD